MLVGVGAVVGCHKHTYDTDVWTKVDDTYHWHAANCGHDVEGIDKTEHRLDRNYKCTDCGFQHEHTYSDKWTAQGKEGHYHLSSCGHDVRTQIEEHTFVNFKCTVCGYELEPNGIIIEKETKEYNLTADQKTLKIGLDDVKIYENMENGEKGRQLSSDEYDLILRLGTNDIEPPTTIRAAGDYQVWAVRKNDSKMETFCTVHVLNTLVGLELVNDATGSVFSQKRHRRDLITDTWVFKATYANRYSTNVTVADGVVVTDFLPSQEGSGVAKATFSETNYKGDVTSQEAAVNYSITHSDFVPSYPEISAEDLFGAVTVNTSEDTLIKEWAGGKITATATEDKGMTTDNGGGYIDNRIPSNSRTFTKCLSVGGVGNRQARSVKIELNEIADNEIVTIVIYVKSRAEDSRLIGLYDHTFEDKDSTPEAVIGEPVAATAKSGPIRKYEFDLTARQVEESGTFYIAGETAAFYLYDIEILYCET